MNYHPKNLPVEDYLLAQGRFKHLTQQDLGTIQQDIDKNWDELARRECQDDS